MTSFPRLLACSDKMAANVATLTRRAAFERKLCGCKMFNLRTVVNYVSKKDASFNFRRCFTKLSSMNRKNNEGISNVDNENLKLRSQKTNFTHFGYENVTETEKKQKGSVLFSLKYSHDNFLSSQYMKLVVFVDASLHT